MPRLGLGNNTDFPNTVDLQWRNQFKTTLRCQFLQCPDERGLPQCCVLCSGDSTKRQLFIGLH